MHGDAGQAARAVLPVPLGRDLRQPRRRASRASTCATSRSPGERDPELEQAMATARETVRLGLAARAQAKLKVRQPLRAAVVVATGAEREAIERFAELVARRAERPRAAVRLRGRRARRGRGQAELQDAGPAVRQADAARRRRGRGAGPVPWRRRCARAGRSRSRSAAPDHDPDRRRSARLDEAARRATRSSGRARTRSRSSSRSATSCATRGGPARSSTRSRRRGSAAGLEVTDRIVLTLDGDPALLAAARTHEGYLANETLASRGRLRVARRRRARRDRRARAAGRR